MISTLPNQMDQNASTPRGGPLPKRANLAIYNDPNLEQTLLMDTTNFGQQLQKADFGQKAEETSTMDNSLDECSFMKEIGPAHVTLDLPPHPKNANLSLVREDEELTLTSNASNPDQKENSGDIQALLKKCALEEQELRNMSANLLLSPVQESEEVDVDGKENDVEKKDEKANLSTLEPQLQTPVNVPTTPVSLHQTLNTSTTQQTPTQTLSTSAVQQTPIQIRNTSAAKRTPVQIRNTSAAQQTPAQVQTTQASVTPAIQKTPANEIHEVSQSFILSPHQSAQFQQVEDVQMTPQRASFHVQADVHAPTVAEAQTPVNVSFGMSPAPVEVSKHPNTPMNGDVTMEQNGVQPELVQSTLEGVKNATMPDASFVLSPMNYEKQPKSDVPATPLSISAQADTIQPEQVQTQQDPSITLYEQSFVLPQKVVTPHLENSHPSQKSPFAKVKNALGNLIRSPSNKSRKRSVTLSNVSGGRGKFEELGEKTFQAPRNMADTPVYPLNKDPELTAVEFRAQPQETMCMDVSNVSAIQATPSRTPAHTNFAKTTPARGVDMNATLSEFVQVSSLVRDIVEAEVPVETEKIDHFSDKLSNLDFMMAEYAVAILNRQPSKVLMPEITDHLGDCVRELIQLVGDSNKSKFQALMEKERADFEYALNIERQKIKNGMQERQMLCARIDELEQGEEALKSKSNELQDELKRCMNSLDEADSLENELLRYKAKCAQLEQNLEPKK